MHQVLMAHIVLYKRIWSSYILFNIAQIEQNMTFNAIAYIYMAKM